MQKTSRRTCSAFGSTIINFFCGRIRLDLNPLPLHQAQRIVFKCFLAIKRSRHAPRPLVDASAKKNILLSAPLTCLTYGFYVSTSSYTYNYILVKMAFNWCNNCAFEGRILLIHIHILFCCELWTEQIDYELVIVSQ